MQTMTKDIADNKVHVTLGSMTQIPCDAYVVPQPSSRASTCGVAKSIAQSGANACVQAYSAALEAIEGWELPLGDAIVTESGGGNSSHLIHVSSIDAGAADQFSIIQKSIYNALVQAHRNQIKTIAIPALGTGLHGGLDYTQSAKAMMSAIYAFGENGGRLDDIHLVIYGDEAGYSKFVDVLDKANYKNPPPGQGQNPFNFAAWVSRQEHSFGDVAGARGL